jgi:hypothetical protein
MGRKNKERKRGNREFETVAIRDRTRGMLVNLYILAISISSFAIGFCFAIALMVRASIRPSAVKVLAKAGLIKQHKAFVPKKNESFLEL